MSTPLAHLKVGTFTLTESVGKGGMGEVFKAVHADQDVAVAIKIMMARRARDPRFRDAFRREVRAVGRLDHPAIILVFDAGEVSPELEDASAGRFVAGSAWLAMELAHFSLHDIDAGALDWWQIKNILTRILDALAHSHARGVIHRDLKPANVLFVQSPDGVQLKLTDFGLAHALDEDRPEDDFATKVTGTPRFMAPEQITGQWRDQGPWTDLYSLGCLAYWLASGEPPFHVGNTERILKGHLYEALPALQTRTPIPGGFKPWLRRLLAKDPSARFRRAADAARELLNLPDPPGAIGRRRPLTLAHLRRDATGHADDMGMTELIGDVLTLPPVRSSQDLSVRSSQDLTEPPAHPSMPRTWRRKQAHHRALGLAGVGLGLFTLRQIPFVDRVAERDALWGALEEVHQRRIPRAIILSGMPGTGKTRLAEWVAERAHEVGAATILTAHHSPISGPADGVGRMLTNYLRCTGLNREQILERVRRFVGEDGPLDVDDLHECLALTELIAPAADPRYDEAGARVRFHTPRERHIVFQRFLARLCARRPVMLVFDDIHWNDESLGYVEALFTPLVQSDLPVLVVMTVGDEGLHQRPLANRQLHRMEDDGHVTSLVVRPLDEADQRELVDHLLGLQSDLAETVVRRTKGNPLYAVQLVGDWIDRGLLTLGKEGYGLRPGETAWLPDDMHHVMRDRIEQLVGQDLDGPAGDALIALELAATLGQDVERREWEYLCRLRGVHLPLLIVDAMVSGGLAQVSRQGWSFTQGAFRDSLERMAREGARWQDHHRLAAKMLEAFYGVGQPGVGQPGVAGRIARHLVEAQAFEEALDPILRACDYGRRRCDFEPAYVLHDLYDECIEHLATPALDPRRVQGWTSRAHTLGRHARFEEALELLDNAEPLARSLQWRSTLAHVLLIRGSVYKERGQILQGIALTQEARALFDELDDRQGQVQCLYLLGELLYWEGNFHEALSYYLRAIKEFEALDEPYEIAAVKMSLGDLYPKLGRTEEGIENLEEAIETFQRYGDSNALANCLNTMGEVSRKAGRLAQAEVYYQQALTTLERIGLHDDTIIMVNLGLTLLAQKKYAEADRLFKRALELLRASNRKGYIGLAHICNLPTSAVHRDWRRWDHHISEGRRLLVESGMVDTDMAEVLKMAAELAIEAGQTERGEQALRLAQSQFEALATS